jgi:hypothetical protein
LFQTARGIIESFTAAGIAIAAKLYETDKFLDKLKEEEKRLSLFVFMFSPCNNDPCSTVG